MYLLVGIIIGLLQAILFICLFCVFKEEVFKKTTKVLKTIEKKSLGGILYPLPPLEEKFQNLVKKNKAAGKPTNIDKFYEDNTP